MMWLHTWVAELHICWAKANSKNHGMGRSFAKAVTLTAASITDMVAPMVLKTICVQLASLEHGNEHWEHMLITSVKFMIWWLRPCPSGSFKKQAWLTMLVWSGCKI